MFFYIYDHLWIPCLADIFFPVKLIFSRAEPNIVAGDKLSPGTNPGFLKSEENVKLHTFIYTKSVSENICVYKYFYFNILVVDVMADVMPLCIDT